MIGEAPHGIPNNSDAPYITQVAPGEAGQLHVFGDDYPTADGTGVRKLSPCDGLAEGTPAAALVCWRSTRAAGLPQPSQTSPSRISSPRLANGIKVPYAIALRRDGDIAVCYADVVKPPKIWAGGPNVGWRIWLEPPGALNAAMPPANCKNAGKASLPRNRLQKPQKSKRENGVRNFLIL